MELCTPEHRFVFWLRKTTMAQHFLAGAWNEVKQVITHPLAAGGFR
jgi:hypothetical protein